MAEKKQESKKVDNYPRIPIDTSIEHESNRRNISIIKWYSFFIKGALLILICNLSALVISGFFAYVHVPPRVFASAFDGGLYEPNLINNNNWDDLNGFMVNLERETVSKQNLKQRQGLKTKKMIQEEQLRQQQILTQGVAVTTNQDQNAGSINEGSVK